MNLRYVLRSEIGTLYGPQGTPGGVMAWKGNYSSIETYAANDAVMYGGRGFYALQATTGNAPPSYPDESNAYWTIFAERGQDGVDGTSRIWTLVAGSPARITNSTFRIQDIGNIHLYQNLLRYGSIISWTSAGGEWRVAKLIESYYADDYVYCALIGSPLESGFTNMQYCTHGLLWDIWNLPGEAPHRAVPGIGKEVIFPEDRYVISAQAFYKIGPPYDAIYWDINDDGVSIFTTKIAMPLSYTIGPETACDNVTASSLVQVSANSKLTLDCDNGTLLHSSGSGVSIRMCSIPVSWRYRE